jgi:hypothetical protein
VKDSIKVQGQIVLTVETRGTLLNFVGCVDPSLPESEAVSSKD